MHLDTVTVSQANLFQACYLLAQHVVSSQLNVLGEN